MSLPGFRTFLLPFFSVGYSAMQHTSLSGEKKRAAAFLFSFCPTIFLNILYVAKQFTFRHALIKNKLKWHVNVLKKALRSLSPIVLFEKFGC